MRAQEFFESESSVETAYVVAYIALYDVQSCDDAARLQTGIKSDFVRHDLSNVLKHDETGFP